MAHICWHFGPNNTVNKAQQNKCPAHYFNVRAWPKLTTPYLLVVIYQKRNKYTLKKGNVAFTFQISLVEGEECQDYGLFTKLQKSKKEKKRKRKQTMHSFVHSNSWQTDENMLQTPNKDQHLRGNIEWSQAQLNWPSKKTWEINLIGPCFDEDK